MHTIEIPGPTTLLVHHNSDWSGDIYISGVKNDETGEPSKEVFRATLKGRQIVTLARRVMEGAAAGLIEKLFDGLEKEAKR